MSRIPYSLTHSQTLKDRATQLLIKYKSGALVTHNVLMFQNQSFQRRSALPREYQSGTIKCRSAPIGANYFIECAAAKRLTMGAALPIGHQTVDFSDTSQTSHRWADSLKNEKP